jgi:hypothetical protein
MRNSNTWRGTVQLVLIAGLAGVGAVFGGACVAESGIIVISQNQIPAFDSMTGMCAVSATGSDVSAAEGILDLGVGDTANYLMWPVIQSRLPPLATMGRAEPNRVQLSHVHVTIRPPVGFNFPWMSGSGCGDGSDPSFSLPLDPGASASARVEAILPCQAKQILAQFKPGGLNPDLNERIIFTVEIRAHGTRSSGDAISSDPYKFPVRVCVGCLQTGFLDLAQYNYPGLPRCDVAPRPNPHKGNPCNIAQDQGPLLCCLDDNSKPVCPSPDK